MTSLEKLRPLCFRARLVLPILCLITLTTLCFGRLSIAGAASTFVVTNTNDTGPGSLRQAILDANSNPGADQITFDISSSARTIAPLSALPNIVDPVVIDAATQPGFAGSPLIELSGNNIFSFPNTGVLNISAGNTTIRGLVISHFKDRGIAIFTAGGNHIEGNYIGTDITGKLRTSSNGNGITVESPNNVIGGVTASTRNIISGMNAHGISIFGASANGNVIQGNYIGTDVTGTADLGNSNDGIFLGTSNNTVGGTAVGARNVISGNDIGIEMQVNGTSGNLIQGNYIGTDASGQNKIENTNYGIAIFNSSNNNTIGGTTATARNVVSGNGWGISIASSSGIPSSNLVQGNYIGLAADGKSPLGNRVEGLRLASATNTTVGGASAGAGNIIAFNGPTAEVGVGTGLEVLGGENNSIRGNSIFSNGRLGIDLGNDGVTNNDTGDSDGGSNLRQNFPVITNVVVSAGSVNIQGTLNSVPNTTYQLDFYANSVCDAVGFGEGARWVGTAPVTTNVTGDASFNVNFSVALIAGQVITSTATDPVGNTSEFSQCSSLSTSVGSISFVSTSVTVNENDANAIFALTRTGGSVGPVNVDYAVANGSAITGSDFAPTQGTVSFADGETSKTLSVPLIDDNVNEPTTETASVSLSSSGELDVVGVQSLATLTITDNDPVPNISIGNVSSSEGDSGTKNFNFPVTLSAPSAQQVTVSFFLTNGTATGGGNDFFLPISNSVTFEPSQTEATITVQVIGDITIEPDETFFVNLSNAINGNIVTSQGLGTILNDDATPTVSLSLNDVSVNEGNSGTTDAVFTVTLSGTSTKTVTTDVNVSGVTATPGTDFQNTTPSLTFSPGQTVQTFSVHVIGDTIFEGNETFRVDLTNVVNANIGDGTGVGTINDDESQPTLSVNDITVVEGDSGTSNAVFTVTLSGPSAFGVGFAFNLADGSAKEHEDFSGVGGGALIIAGQTTRTITVPIIGDTITEGAESFFINISDPSNATIADGQGICTIQDNEGPSSPPTFQFNAKFFNVSESAGSVELTVTRTGNASAATVQYETSPVPGTSVSDRSDYTLALGTLHFASGETTKSFTILLTDDSFVEGPENFSASLSNPTGGVALGQPSTSIVTIFDNDVTPPTSNPIDTTQLFVRQHYHDFLNREPDASGFAFWQNEIDQCGNNNGCVEIKRINVSAAFFLSIEFQETGYFVYRMYKSGFGNLAGAPVPVRVTDFIRDTQQIGQGVQVGVGNWQAQLENNKQTYVLSFVQQPAFLAGFPNTMTAEEFVTRLDANAGGVLSAAERSSLVGQLEMVPSDVTKRAQVLRAVAEDQDLKNAEFNKAFVLMQYFGYLRRNPNDGPDSDYSGYNFWLGKLDQFQGNFVNAEMVKAFISSIEYRQRFGP